MNLIFIGITQVCSTLSINYGLFYVYCFYLQNQNEKLGLTICWEFMRLWNRWYNQGPKDLFFTFCKVPAARSSEITGRKKISSSWWRMKIPVSFTRLGEEVAVHFVIRRNTCIAQAPKTLSLPSITLHTGKGHRHARDSLYWMQMSPKEQVYSVKLPQQHQLLMKSWGERGEEGYMFRHIVKITLQTSLCLKKNKMKTAGL